MVRGAAAGQAASYAALHPDLSLGLHIDLGEWMYVAGRWSPVYEVVPLADPAAVEAEVARQLNGFRQLTGSDPTHIDSHQHVHMFEPVLHLAEAVASRLGIPLRGRSKRVRHCGEFYGQTGTGDPLPDGITFERLSEIVSELPGGVTELGCHPGQDPELDSPYRLERMREVATLTDERWPARLAAKQVELTSFAEVEIVDPPPERPASPAQMVECR